MLYQFYRPLCAVLLALLAGPVLAQTATTAGSITTPYPTIENISVEWAVSGDSDLDGEVFVRFRRLGTLEWRDNMSLRRIPAGSNAGFSWANRHSGSVFNLEPDTTYQIELSLVDPDGGSNTQVVIAATRPVPVPMFGATVIAVTPQSIDDALSSAVPGVIFELAAGSYGDIEINDSGLPGQPIVLRGQPGVVVNGEVRIVNENHVMVTDMTVNGRIFFNGTDNMTVTNCVVNASAANGFDGHGIVDFRRVENAYIADNIVTGTTIWRESAFGAQGDNLGEGIRLSGPGHVIMNNRVSGFRDNISFGEDSGATDQFSIDVLNNIVTEGPDDGIEADFCEHNCRIMRNQLTNNFISFSSQPGLGGPTYFIRNVAYNVALTSFKLLRGSEGDVLIHNTVVKAGDALGIRTGATISRMFSRNNLLIGGPGGSYNGFNIGDGDVIRITALDTATADLNYDALGSTSNFDGRYGGTRFDGIDELHSLTSEVSAVEVGLDTFAQIISIPDDPPAIYLAPDLRLASGSAATDVGIPIANLNDGFAGSAPDAGAYELNAPLPEYGPREPVIEGLIFRNGFE